MENQEETIYIKRILEGETHLFSCFLEKYSQSIFSVIIRIIPLKEEAEELVQDTFLKAFRKLNTFKGECSFSTWLYRIAYNTAISETRKRKIVFPLLDEKTLESISEDEMDTVFDREEDEALLQKLEKALDQLNVEDKTLITLYYYESRSVSEIASVLEQTSDNIKVKLFRARKKIYTFMNQ